MKSWAKHRRASHSPCRPALVWVPGLCSQYPMVIPDTLRTVLFMIAEIMETACFVLMKIMCSVAYFEHQFLSLGWPQK